MKTQKQIRSIAAKPIVFDKYLALSFILPFAILGTAFALNKIYPFGDRQILIGDFQHQYYPFLSNLWHKLRESGVSTWSWTAGLGHDYTSLFAYYLSSPLNLPALLLSHAWLREVLGIVLLAKIGFAGLFTAMFLRYMSQQCGSLARKVSPLTGRAEATGQPALPVFSSLYALCAFTLGYYYNIIWFDSFALLPLVMLGFFALMNKGEFKLYVVSLALAVWSNFYIGFFICVFVATAFLYHCVSQKIKWRDFFQKLGVIAGFSCLAIGMTAALTLPAWFALRNADITGDIFPTQLKLYNSFFDVLGQFIAFTPPTFKEGLPNLYCGMASVLLASVFFVSSKIDLRKKIALAGIVVFLLLSCNLNVLNFIMHGFHFTNMMPARFSFLAAFTLVVMAYHTFLLTEGVSRWSLLVMGLCAALFLLAAFFGSQENKYVIGSAVLCVVYLAMYYFIGSSKGKAQKLIRPAFLVVIIVELFLTSWMAFKAAPYSKRNEYPDRYNQLQKLLTLRQPVRNDFYRTDVDKQFMNNDPSLYNYNGISFFSSMIDYKVAGFMQGLGLLGDKHLFLYNKTSPLVNLFLNMRYLLSRTGQQFDQGAYWEPIGKAGDSFLLENKFYLSLGFMVNDELADYVHNEDNPFLSQNDLFRRATGLEGDLFTTTDVSINYQNMESERNYSVPTNGMMFVHCKSEVINTVIVYRNNAYLGYVDFPSPMACTSIMGILSQGDIVTFEAEDDALIIAAYFDQELFERGYSLLAGAPLSLTKFTNIAVCGNVTAYEDGLLWTSIPGKNWSVYVDGKKSEMVLIDNAMAAVRLKKGFHEIEFKYFNKSFLIGIIISLASLGIFVTLIFLKKNRKLPSC